MDITSVVLQLITWPIARITYIIQSVALQPIGILKIPDRRLIYNLLQPPRNRLASNLRFRNRLTCNPRSQARRGDGGCTELRHRW